jgi:hypothetical protein
VLVYGVVSILYKKINKKEALKNKKGNQFQLSEVHEGLNGKTQET